MIDRNPPEEVALAVALVEEATRRNFSVGLEDFGGLQEWALRIDLASDEPSVAIYLTNSPYTATAALVPDTFAGRLVRFLGDQAKEVADLWQRMVDEFALDGTQVMVNVNGTARKPIEAVDVEWQSLEIEASTKIQERPVNPQTRGRALASSALGVLSLFVACFDHDNQVNHTEDAEELGDEEGAPVLRLSRQYERKKANRIRCLNHHGYSCVVCGFNFEERYGSLGAGFVEVHHIFPVASMPEGYRPDPRTEMVPLCANCHRMVHKSFPPLDPDELRRRLPDE